MTERSTPNNTPLIIAAIIGAIGGIFAACIGLIPTILPMVRATSTPIASSYTFTFTATTFSLPTATDTPIPDTATVTLTPTVLPTLTATLEPLPTDTPVTETPTITVTAIPPASDMDAYVGTWTNVDKDPQSDKVRLVVTRIDITQTGDAVANFSVCRATKGGERYVEPNPAAASVYVLGLGARDFIIPTYQDLRWAIVVQRTAEQLVATVQEYDTNNILHDTDTFNLEKATLLDPANLVPCKSPTK